MEDGDGDDRRGERLAALFLLGVGLFNPLFVGIFGDRPVQMLGGIPRLYLFLFGSWAVIIALMAIIVERRGNDADAGGEEPPESATGGPA